MASRATWKVNDYSGEAASVALNGPTLSSATYDAQVAEVSGIRTALDAITLGVIASEQIVASTEAISAALPASPYAQRELKLLFSYEDTTTGQRYTFTVPAPDLAVLETVEGSDAVVLADAGVMAAFVTAVEGWALSPDGNLINILSCRVVGRNI